MTKRKKYIPVFNAKALLKRTQTLREHHLPIFGTQFSPETRTSLCGPLRRFCRLGSVEKRNYQILVHP